LFWAVTLSINHRTISTIVTASTVKMWYFYYWVWLLYFWRTDTLFDWSPWLVWHIRPLSLQAIVADLHPCRPTSRVTLMCMSCLPWPLSLLSGTTVKKVPKAFKVIYN